MNRIYKGNGRSRLRELVDQRSQRMHGDLEITDVLLAAVIHIIGNQQIGTFRIPAPKSLNAGSLELAGGPLP
jgi:hypothetical protein